MRRSRLSAGTWLALSAGVLAVATLVAVGAALIAAHHLTQARQRVVDRVDVATNTALVLSNAMVNQETGVRGFVLGGEEQFLDPYRVGVANAARAQRQLQALAQAEMSGRLPGDLARARRAIDAWQSGYARPTIDRIRRFGAGRIEDTAVAAGKARFDVVRASLGRLQADLRADRADARADLAGAAASLTRALVFAAILLALALLAIAILGRQIIAVPIARLARQTRAVASGELHRVIEPSGPSDIERLGRDVESMRARIVQDLEAVRAAEEEIQQKAVALERSNAELEQFAYVASHDLQEPLRKVTSFCQMIERRYSGQLDERGEQYIAFAVDGAKRMQALINDLLAFSRVGRVERPRELVDLEELVGQATSALSLAVEETGATVEVRGDLPEVYGERSLLGLVLPEPDLQRDQVPRRRAARGARLGPPRRRALGARRGRQRHRHRPRVRRSDLRHLPAPARQGRLRGHRDRAHDVPEGHRVPRRGDLARGQPERRRLDLPLHAAGPRYRHRGGHAMNQNLNVIEVLLVEDDPGDIVLIREAFEHNKVYNALHVVSDGVQALEFLRREGDYADAPRPDLMLLDLNLPRKDGREVLAEVKEDAGLRTIPVVVLTTSEAEEDIARSYDLHANAYVSKPVDFDRFIEVVRQIDDFFVSVVKLPNRH